MSQGEREISRRDFLRGALITAGLGVAGGTAAVYVRKKGGLSQALEGIYDWSRRVDIERELRSRLEYLHRLHPDTEPTVQKIWMGKGDMKGQYPIRGMGVIAAESSSGINGYPIDEILKALFDASGLRMKVLSPQALYNFGETWLTVPFKDGKTEKAFIHAGTNAMVIRENKDTTGAPYFLDKEALAVSDFPLVTTGVSYEDPLLGFEWNLTFVPEDKIPSQAAYFFVGVDYGAESTLKGYLLDDSELVVRRVDVSDPNRKVSGRHLVIATPPHIKGISVFFTNMGGRLVGYNEVSLP